MRVRRLGLMLSVVALAAACARYEPAPVDPAVHPAAYRGRRLNDSALVAVVSRHAGAPQVETWTDRQLAVAALVSRAELEAARRSWLAARAGVRTAGARPAPGVEGQVERAFSGNRGESPWVVSLTALFTIELGGKRAARVQHAWAREAIAESDLIQGAIVTRARVRSAAVTVVHAEEILSETARIHQELESVAELERGRFQEASMESSELARTGAELALARADVAAAEREVIAARAALAGTVAVPTSTLHSVRVVVAPPQGCAWADSVGPDSLLGLAALRRPEVTRALGQYALAESEVRMQVARQRPDLELGPGYIFDQGIHRWTLGFALPALLGFRNRAPIEEAQAARAAAAAHVDEVQDAVLAQAGEALEGCRAARTESAVADSVGAAAAELVAIARARYERGETGRLDQARAELAAARGAAAQRAARRRLELAGLAIEAAVSEWHGSPAETWPDPHEQPFRKEPDR
jgi:cobalt-zinc-cadmium efflux system outer membrane protein